MVEFPKRVDIMPTAHCNLNCPFCWGPDHSIKDGLNTDQWFLIIASLCKQGTTDIVFTGGEPLIRPDIKTLMMVSHLLGFNVTLSTNCLLLSNITQQSPNVLDYTHEIGIPIDGSTIERNNTLRIGSPKQFNSAISTLSMIQAQYPQIHTTIRTVVTQQNIDDISNIGTLVSSLKPDRWKLYEFVAIGEGLVNANFLAVSTEQFTDLVSNLANKHPELLIEGQSSSIQSEKYLFVGPHGDFYSIGKSLEHIPLGNPLEIGEEVIERVQTHFSENLISSA
ncbi:radical SAM protein [Candidatus Microgenomates bacterium]|nr:radical SAM protein [Candidatus Microgenomates bacterium]